MSSTQDTIQKLLDQGPHKHEATPRRVRGLFNASWVFDTVRAVYVWEHPWYPYFYIPAADLDFQTVPQPSLESTRSPGSPPLKAWHGVIRVAEKELPLVGFDGAGPLQGLVRFDFQDLDAWFVEDERIYAHPKDPYKRIECIPSSRTVRVEVDGQVLAESSNNIFLFETGLRPRYYLAATGVDPARLTPSDTSTFCPYKGQASYYHIKVQGREIRDAIWWYRYPTPESAAVAGRLCFYNEKVDIFIDGRKDEN